MSVLYWKERIKYQHQLHYQYPIAESPVWGKIRGVCVCVCVKETKVNLNY